MRDVLELLAGLEDQQDRRVFAYDRRGRQQAGRSWAETLARGRGVGASLQDAGLAPGTEVFLQLPNSHELIEGFLGALSAGLLPCCLAPPRALGGLDTFQARMRALTTQFPNSTLIAQPDVGEAAGVPFVPPPAPADRAASTPAVEPETVAFLQLTSGSTRHPKAVRISHRALVANVRNIVAAGKGTHDDAFVTWLPFYHDMGLVGSLFCSIGLRSDLHVLQPETFVARPRTWLQVISDVRETVISTAPNFAYESCAQRIGREEAEQLDLSRWRLAGCGAERVRPETMARFAEHFAAAGFRSEAYVPCYGMAETTLAVTFGSGERRPTVDRGHVSCGAPIPETEIVIRSPEGESLPEGAQGEITVKSTSLLSGYTGAEHPAPLRDGWLYTGDRGYLKDGELYVTGRYKDLIIVDGVNIDPDEIELIGEGVVQVAGARSAAFSVEVDGRERVVLVSEVGTEDDDVLQAWAAEIGDRVARLFGFRLLDLAFVRRGAMAKTSSGKVQRTVLRSQYRANELEIRWRQGAGA